MPRRRCMTCLQFSGWMIVLLLSSAVTPAQESRQASSQDAKTDELPTSEAELRQLFDDAERKIKDLEPTSKEWATVLVSVQNAKDGVLAAEPPDPSALDQAAASAAAGKIADASEKVTTVIDTFETLSRRAGPGIGQRSTYSEADIAQFYNKWQSKIGTTTKPFLDENLFGRYIRLSFGIGEKPKAEDFTKNKIDELKSKLTRTNFQQLQQALGSNLADLLADAQQGKKSVDDEVTSLSHKRSAISAKLSKAKTQINELAIWLGLPLFCFTVLLMLCVPIIVQTRTTSEASKEQLKAIFGSGILVEIITVLLLTMTILILGLSDKVQGEVLGTLLGGISGYVLNRFRVKSKPEETENATNGKTAQAS